MLKIVSKQIDRRVHERIAELSNIIQLLKLELHEHKRAANRHLGLLKYAPDAMIVVEHTGKIVLTNRQAEKLFDYKMDELVGKKIETLIPKRFRRRHIKLRAEYFTDPRSGVVGEHREIIGRRKDDSEFPIELTLSPLETESGTLVTAAIRDISERKRAEQQLRKLSHAIEQSASSVIITDAEGKIEYVNPKFTKLSGYSLEEVKGKNPRILKSGETQKNVYRTLWNDITSGKEWQGELHNRKKNGELYWTFCSISPLRDTKGEITHFIANQEDITQRKLAEVRLREQAVKLAFSNAELEQFAYIASHDLQEPLRMVSAYLELFMKRYGTKLNAEAREFIDYARDGAIRMRNLINNLLIFSKAEKCSLKFEPTNFENVLHAILVNLETSIRERGAQITHDPLPTIDANPQQMEQLFQNLIGNAIKFSKDRTLQIHVSVAWDERKKQWVFSVHDNGIGIEKQDSRRIFKSFERLSTKRDYPGTGLGLAICKKIVECHGGRIWVESEPGCGSTFYFTVPFLKEK